MLLKADLHLHQEWSPRLDRVLARRYSRTPFDWDTWRAALTTQVAPGVARLQRLSRVFPAPAQADTDDAFVDRVTDTLLESAAAGSCYAELRFSYETVVRPAFMDLFRQAEDRVRAGYPQFYAEAVASVLLWQENEQLDSAVATCRRLAGEGLAGVDLLNVPYSSQADWQAGRRVAASCAQAGLGVTVHAGEFAPANIVEVASMEGVTRIGHATKASTDPWLVELLAARGVTVEVCLTANLILGAVDRLSDHPLRGFLDAGVTVALGTDNPVQFGTTIDAEYALAGDLGLSTTELTSLTTNAINASFTTPQRRSALVADAHATPATV